VSWPPDARRFRGLRVVGDVHGEAEAFAHAVAGAAALELFLLQLGDLTDHGPDSPAVLRTMFALLDAGAGRFLLGNHEHRLRRALIRRAAAGPHGLTATLAQLDAAADGEALRRRAIAEIARAPAWATLGQRLFVHAAAHPVMVWRDPPPDAGARKPEGPVARALFGEVLDGLDASGYPRRSLAWVDDIPMGCTAYVGHDNRSSDGRPHRREGRAGGAAIFLDTGAGKGGHLSWLDLPW
jgi:protein phosphatase